MRRCERSPRRESIRHDTATGSGRREPHPRRARGRQRRLRPVDQRGRPDMVSPPVASSTTTPRRGRRPRTTRTAPAGSPRTDMPSEPAAAAAAARARRDRRPARARRGRRRVRPGQRQHVLTADGRARSSVSSAAPSRTGDLGPAAVRGRDRPVARAGRRRRAGPAPRRPPRPTGGFPARRRRRVGRSRRRRGAGCGTGWPRGGPGRRAAGGPPSISSVRVAMAVDVAADAAAPRAGRRRSSPRAGPRSRPAGCPGVKNWTARASR